MTDDRKMGILGFDLAREAARLLSGEGTNVDLGVAPRDEPFAALDLDFGLPPRLSLFSPRLERPPFIFSVVDCVPTSFLREAMHSLRFLAILHPTDRRREKREARLEAKRGRRSSRGWRKHKRRTKQCRTK